MRLADQGLAVGAQQVKVLDHLRGLPAVVAIEEVSVAGVAARIGLIQPGALTRAVEPSPRSPREVADDPMPAVLLGDAEALTGPARRRGELQEVEQQQAGVGIEPMPVGLEERAV